MFGLFAFHKKVSLLFLLGGVVLVGKILFSMMEVLTMDIARAFRTGVPLVAVTTGDPAATLRTIEGQFSEFADPVGIIAWDCMRGAKCKPNDAVATGALSALPEQDYSGSMVAFLADLDKLSKRNVVVILNAHLFMDDPRAVQAVWNLRDDFKANKKVLVLLGVAVLPPELIHDVVQFDDPLPQVETLQTIIGNVCEWAGFDRDEQKMQDGANAAIGVTAFCAENLACMAMDKNEGLEVDRLWESKRRKIDQTPGLRVVTQKGGFDAVGGCDQYKTFMRRVLKGKHKPRAIVFVDEIEKCLGAAGSDTSGVSQDQLGQLLSWMQDRRATGTILVGPPGAAKSAVAKAAGSEGGIPTIQFDLGGMKGSLVGQSEQQIREALKVIDAISGGETLWIATCNSLTELPPELKRRFKLGTWFFDLPDLAERQAIWAIYARKFGHTDKAAIDRLTQLEWTGAEIESCCETADSLGITLEEASAYIVPVAKQAPEAITKLRQGAEGRFLSASVPGPYTRTKQSGNRSFE